MVSTPLVAIDLAPDRPVGRGEGRRDTSGARDHGEPVETRKSSEVGKIRRIPLPSRPMTQTRGENFEGQREAILSRAAELFALHGYHGTSMNDVAEACRLSKATLYHYYVDKSELLGNIAERHVSALVQLCEIVRTIRRFRQRRGSRLSSRAS
jgi:Bacterial regulatory proteins, tetR family